jgi:thymidylate synthase (FAD)
MEYEQWWVDPIMEVELIDYMGSDLTVANAARVSFNKRKSKLDHKDKGLIRYLATHKHWTPFAHPQITLRIKVPFFVAAQIKKHQVGFVVNEVSRRYVDTEPEFYYPDFWRKRADDKKQGSSDEEFAAVDGEVWQGYDGWTNEHQALWDAQEINHRCLTVYEDLIEEGLCPEQARMFLPMNTFTEFWMTGSLYGWFNMWSQRSKDDTQKETREVAYLIKYCIEPLFPVSWEELENV